MSPARDEFGIVYVLRAGLRRRAGRQWTRLRYPRATFGRLCDIHRGVSLLIARDATAVFGPTCVLDHGFVLECRGSFTVGEGTSFGHHCTVAVVDSVQIGRNCLIAEMVSIRDHDHEFASEDVPIALQGRRQGPVRIGDNVWLGAKVTVTQGVSIGANTVVGANAVVTHDLPPDSVAVGVPARVIRSRGTVSQSRSPE